MPGLPPRTTIIAVLMAFASGCGVVLPAPQDGVWGEQGAEGPATTKGANMPAPPGESGEAGVSVTGAPTSSTQEAGASPRPYAVFVTAEEWPANEVGGLVAADEKCSAAASRGLAILHNKTWAAWLSDGTTGALSRLADTPGPWFRPDGVLVATDRAHLGNVAPFHAPIAIDENGAPHADDVWTGTSADGTSSSDTCVGWSGSNGDATYGRIDLRKPGWTSYGDAPCESGYTPSGGYQWGPRNRLYCFEID